jgi:hypothetical protein
MNPNERNGESEWRGKGNSREPRATNENGYCRIKTNREIFDTFNFQILYLRLKWIKNGLGMFSEQMVKWQ